MGKASEEGQGPSGAVKPMMMMKLISTSIFYNLTRTFYWIGFFCLSASTIKVLISTSIFYNLTRTFYWIGFFCLSASTIKVIQALKFKMSIQML